MDRNKIFISHSSKDIKIVQLFIETILRLGLDIDSSRIFCSSMEGQGVKSGQYIPDRLKEEMKLASIVFLFISKNYKRSEVCLNEIGAAWISLEKDNIIPILLPDTDFAEIGFLNLGSLGIKLSEKAGILKLIEDLKEQLNPDFNLERLGNKIDSFIKEVKIFIKTDTASKVKSSMHPKDLERMKCFDGNLIPFDDILRQILPAFDDGIYEIHDKKLQNKILTKLSKANFLDLFWYKKAEGDGYVKKLKKTSTGDWLISMFNWEIKISSFWVSLNISNQYEFILIKSESQPPFKIDSDIGGEEYSVGMMNDGTIITDNERLNGYAIIGGETIDLREHGVEPRTRYKNSQWVFFASDYHKVGYNADETIAFCEKLDSEEIEVNETNIDCFLRSLKNNPIINSF